MSLINREVLYEKACDLEAQALAYVGKIANDETKIEKWRIWSAILAERTAFKHDIFDASEVQPEPHWIPVSERLPEDGERVLCTHLGGLNPNRQVIEHIYESGQFVLGWEMDMNPSSPTFMQRYMGKVVAWMPRPEPYREEGEK